jgi:sugar phosphate isomerase/epimerase
VDLAADIGAAYVRTFLGELPPGSTPTDKLYEAMAGCLEVAATHAQAVGVTIAIEPHDDFVLSDTIVPILRRGLHPALGVIWDLGNTFAAGEDPETGFGLLGNHLAYVQVKDGHGRGSQWQLRPLGQGEVPLERAFNLLLSSPYTGAFSVEWEWAWHPELDPPEVALPRALHQVRALLAAAQPATT